MSNTNIKNTNTELAPIEMYKFINDCKSQHLTIADIKLLNIGDRLDVVIWDRNFEELWIWTNADNEVAFTPDEFFSSNRHTLTYLGNMKWNIRYPFGIDFIHNIELDVSKLDNIMKWYPISDDGKIEFLRVSKHWTDFPDDTRVGWRGPIMLWNKLLTMPNVYLKDNYFGENLN
jgi:hypothetical protein